MYIRYIVLVHQFFRVYSIYEISVVDGHNNVTMLLGSYSILSKILEIYGNHIITNALHNINLPFRLLFFVNIG